MAYAGYAHMGPPVDSVLSGVGDIWDDIGKGIDAAKTVKDVIAGHAPVVYPVNTGQWQPVTQAQPSLLGMNATTVLWLGVGGLALLLLMQRK